MSVAVLGKGIVNKLLFCNISRTLIKFKQIASAQT